MPVPTVGRIVHYTNLGDRDGKYPPEVQAAIITGVKKRPPAVEENAVARSESYDYVVDLHIFYRTGDFYMLDVPFTSAEPGSEEARGKWAWPPRVP